MQCCGLSKVIKTLLADMSLESDWRDDASFVPRYSPGPSLKLVQKLPRQSAVALDSLSCLSHQNALQLTLFRLKMGFVVDSHASRLTIKFRDKKESYSFHIYFVCSQRFLLIFSEHYRSLRLLADLSHSSTDFSIHKHHNVNSTRSQNGRGLFIKFVLRTNAFWERDAKALLI